MEYPLQGVFDGRIWLERAHRAFLGPGKVDLLVRIDGMGSIAHAAKAMGMSYKSAWETVQLVNSLSDRPLLVTSRGGVQGGETHLTEYGREVVQVFRLLQAEHERFLRALSHKLGRSHSLEDVGRRFTMRTSARNQYWGSITSVRRGAVNSEVAISIGGDESIVASITNASVDALELKVGKEACALIKASFVVLAPGSDAPRTSARNCLSGTVTRCEMGAVNGEVTIKLKGDHTVTATLTNESIRSLGFAVGSPAAALVKASHVIIAVND
jgi:molybdate transport system regulatory protein